MLGSFFFLVLIILIAEIVAGVWAAMNQKQVENILTKEFQRIIRDEYGINAIANKSVDAVQHDFKCCGAVGPSDWQHSKFNTERKDDSLMGKLSKELSVLNFYRVPASCCIGSDDCTNVPLAEILPTDVYQAGCVAEIETFIKNNLTIIAGVGIGFGVIQILGLIFSIVLCCAIRNGEGVSYHV